MMHTMPPIHHCLCVVMAFLHFLGPVNHLPPFLYVFWCAPQATASICTDRGGICFVVWSSTKVNKERHHEETHTHTLCFLSFSLFTFPMAHLEAVRVPHLHFQLSSPMPFTPLCMEKSDLLMDVFCVFFHLHVTD